MWIFNTYDAYFISINMKLLCIHVLTRDPPKHVSFYFINLLDMSISSGFEYSCSYPMSKLKKNINTNTQLVCWNGHTHLTLVQTIKKFNTIIIWSLQFHFIKYKNNGYDICFRPMLLAKASNAQIHFHSFH
jgi:hypothetical protein